MAATEIGHWYKRPISQKSCDGVMRMLQNRKNGKKEQFSAFMKKRKILFYK